MNYWKKYKSQIQTAFGDILGIVRCAYCGVSLVDADDIRDIEELEPNASADHRVPLSHGGADNFENIYPCCRTCNSSKNAREFGDNWTPDRFDEDVKEEVMNQLGYVAFRAAGGEDENYHLAEWYDTNGE